MIGLLIMSEQSHRGMMPSMSNRLTNACFPLKY